VYPCWMGAIRWFAIAALLCCSACGRGWLSPLDSGVSAVDSGVEKTAEYRGIALTPAGTSTAGAPNACGAALVRAPCGPSGGPAAIAIMKDQEELSRACPPEAGAEVTVVLSLDHEGIRKVSIAGAGTEQAACIEKVARSWCLGTTCSAGLDVRLRMPASE